MKINKHKRGGYYTTITIDGKKRFIYGSTPEEVDAKYTELKYKHIRGHDINQNPTMEEYMIQWYNAYKKGEGAIKTQKMYQNCINNHINPVFGHKKLKDIKSSEIQSFLKNIKGSKSLVHKVRITLNQIFKAAIADKLIDFNPVINTKIIVQDKPKRECLSPVQRELMLHILEKERIYPLVYTLLYTGMRMGEALALTWKDVDLEKRIIKVNKALEFKDAKPLLKAPKTKNGYRDIPISEKLYSFLEKYKETIKNSIYVFPSPEGSMMTYTQITRLYKKAKKKIDKWFEENEEMQKYKFDFTFRLLRHTFCTGLFDAGVDELSAADIMGHDVVVMRSIYTHIQESRKAQTAVKIESLYEEKNEKSKSKKANLE